MTVGRHDFDASIKVDASDTYAKKSGRSALEDRMIAYAEGLEKDGTGAIAQHLMVTRACPHCGGGNANRPLMLKYFIAIEECGDCGFWYTPAMARPTLGGDAKWDEIWSTTHISFLTSETYQYYSSRRYAYELQTVEPFVRARGRHLDIGCSIGGFIEAAAKFGWVSDGVEMNEASAAIAIERGHAVKHAMFTADLFEAETFSMVSCLDIMEHLPDPRRFVRDVRMVLQDGGLFFIQIPNGASLSGLLRWDEDPLYNGLIHFNYFTPHTLTTFMASEGFTCLNSETILSELGHVRRFTPDMVASAATLAGVTTPLSTPPTPDEILDSGLGYKVIAGYRKD